MVHDVAARAKPWTLVYGGRTLTSMAFIGELSEISGGELHIMPEDEYGLLDLDHFLGAPRTDTTVYCCGPGPLIDAVERACDSWPAGALRLERFTPRAVSNSVTDGEFAVELARSARACPYRPTRPFWKCSKTPATTSTTRAAPGSAGRVSSGSPMASRNTTTTS